MTKKNGCQPKKMVVILIKNINKNYKKWLSYHAVTVPLLVRSTSYSINYVRVQANYSIKNARAGFGMHAKAEQVQKKK